MAWTGLMEAYISNLGISLPHDNPPSPGPSPPMIDMPTWPRNDPEAELFLAASPNPADFMTLAQVG